MLNRIAKLKTFIKNEIPSISVAPHLTIEQYFSEYIKPLLPDRSIVIHWNELLLQYANSENVLYPIRKYGSIKKNGVWDCRRGMLVEYDDYGYFFVDNYFPQIIYALVLSKYKPSLEEFKNHITNHTLPIGFSRIVECEKRLSAFPRTLYSSVGLNEKGKKLSHIFDVNLGKNDLAISYFPRGFQSEWKNTKGYYAKSISGRMPSDMRSSASRHFLRLCNPLNSFLSPSDKTLYGRDVGEYREMLEYISMYMAFEYGEEYSKFCINADCHSATFDEKVFSALGKTYISQGASNIKTLRPTKPKKELSHTNLSQKSFQITEDLLVTLAYNFLFLSKSYRVMEKEVLGLENSKGFIAMRIIRKDLGLSTHDKGKYSLGGTSNILIEENSNIQLIIEKVLKKYFA